MSAPIVIDWGGEEIELRSERAALLRRHRTLLVADVHIGKARAFRQQGVPVPGGTTRDTLSRLDLLVRATRAEHVVFLGDLLHSRHAQGSAALEEFAAWRAAHAQLALTLVRGNHDAHAGDPPAALAIVAVEEPFALGTVALCHHPQARPTRRAVAVEEEAAVSAASGLAGAGGVDLPPPRRPARSFMGDALETALGEDDFLVTSPTGRGARRSGARAGPASREAVRTRDDSPAATVAPERPRIAGHVHPCYSVHGRSDSLRLPCFHFADDVAVLPAFGAFTGMHAVRPAVGDRMWVVAGDAVVKVDTRGR